MKRGKKVCETLKAAISLVMTARTKLWNGMKNLVVHLATTISVLAVSYADMSAQSVLFLKAKSSLRKLLNQEERLKILDFNKINKI